LAAYERGLPRPLEMEGKKGGMEEGKRWSGTPKIYDRS